MGPCEAKVEHRGCGADMRRGVEVYCPNAEVARRSPFDGEFYVFTFVDDVVVVQCGRFVESGAGRRVLRG
jgi:hypothetical protein